MLRSLVVCALVANPVAAVAEPAVACRAIKDKMTVSFKPEVSLQELSMWLTSFTCKNVVFGTDVAKHATKLVIIAPGQPMTPKQAIQLFVDGVQSTGLVVKQKADTFTISLGPKMPKACPDLTASADGPWTAPTPTPTPDPDAQKLADQIDKGIRKIDDTHYEIKASLIDTVLANPMAVMKGARVVPAMKDGKPVGIKLYAIRPTSFYGKIGFANGDTIKSVNGLELTSVDKGLDVYTKLRDAKKLEIELVRRGKPMTLTITIVK
ncbi:MAG TPA: type II secretion system protein GspC [Kofleriaceae bacterium]